MTFYIGLALVWIGGFGTGFIVCAAATDPKRHEANLPNRGLTEHQKQNLKSVIRAHRQNQARRASKL